MSYVQDLRNSISETVDAKAAGKAAGAGLWAAYVRSTMWDNTPTTVDAFDERHTRVLAELEMISPLSKEEKNSVTSAKCVIKGAVQRNVDVWRRDDAGMVEKDDNGDPVPRGKSDLQEDRSMFDMLMKAVKGMNKRLTAEPADPLTDEQREEFARAMMDVLLAAGITSK
jgi:hypothetical protein